MLRRQLVSMRISLPVDSPLLRMLVQIIREEATKPDGACLAHAPNVLTGVGAGKTEDVEEPVTAASPDQAWGPAAETPACALAAPVAQHKGMRLLKRCIAGQVFIQRMTYEAV